MAVKVSLSFVTALLLCGFCSAGPAAPSVKAESCWTMGNRHYRTFDGRSFNLVGNCTYVMAKNCHVDKDHPAFEVVAQIKNRAKSLFDSVGLISIEVYGHILTIVHGEYGMVRLDYEAWSLPITLANGKIVLSQSGLSVLIETDFGLKVLYNWEQYLVVTVPGSYAGKMCGLCGNFNGKQADDLASPSGSQAGNVVDLGKSWRVHGATHDASCRDQCTGQCETCHSSWEKKVEEDVVCGLLTRVMDGPFHSCHALINPKDYHKSCVYDVCMGEGLKQYMCDTLQVYTDACQRAGIKVYDWRKLAGCPKPKCPENSHYELCGNACPATCEDPTAPSKCKANCVETCTCNPGYVLSGNKCVPSSQCGCQYEGRYVQPGKSFWADNSCSKRCQCNPSGSKIQCENTGCPNGKDCQVINGIRDCYPMSYATCVVSGDPHYLTFDGHRFNFQGTCVYQMAGVCSKDKSLEPFDVLVQNIVQNKRMGSLTKLVEVKVYGLAIVISKQFPGLVMVNGELTNLPVLLAGEKVFVYKSGLFAVIQTTFGLKVSFDWNGVLFVTVPKTYLGAMCGLCGNYNHKAQDDMQMKDGKMAATGKKLGQSWLMEKTPGCVNDCSGPCPGCDITQKKQYETNEFCGLLKDPSGPFRKCHSKVDPSGFFQDCLDDVCLYKGKNNMQCKTFTAYTAACQEQGVQVYPWRSAHFCNVQCSNDSHYDICGPGCPATCESLSPPAGCNSPCKEGCVCNKNYILNGDQCVPQKKEKCGCTQNGKYYKIGQVFYPSETCQEECTCMQDGKVKCKKFSCGPHEKCEVKNGVRGCQPNGKGVCTIKGDPHYRTFDNKTYDFQGTCTYTVAEGCHLKGTHLTPFSVVVENEKWYNVNKSLAVAKAVIVTVYQNTFILRENQIGMIMVNGILTHLPLNLNNGAVEAYQDVAYDVIITDFGLKVTYDLVYHVTVTVPSNYQGKTCGLCGNFNGDKNDEFQLPDGKITKDLKTFGAAWKASVSEVVCDSGCSGDICPKCNEKKEAVFKKDCSIITDPKGPFAACHNVINPNSYYRDCVYDVCMSEGARDILCHSINAYVFDCQSSGVNIKSWRSPTFCPISCPANSHYQTCAETCATPCPGLSDVINCPLTCAEGCACNSGYFFNGTGCVEWDQCSCYAGGRTYKIGESVISNDCRTNCTCHNTGMVTCESMKCRSDEVCQVKGGVQGCYQRQCLLQPGAVFTLFNGRSGSITSEGAYEIVKVCDQGTVADWFRVVVDVEMCGDRGLIVVAVFAFFENSIVSVNDKQEAWVNGKKVSLPSKQVNGVSIQVSDKMVTIEKKSTMSVSYSVSDGVIVTVSPQMDDKVCGACGKVTDTTILTSVHDKTKMQNHMNSWKAPDFPSCVM